MLGVKTDTMTPQALVQAVLRMPVDLLWNGGIGTYVKAGEESNVAVGDRSNDAVRVNGNELRSRVVGEGGNLGFTQLGRIEYALSGGRINTDFIDNSAGVDCSDHEVNIKILLNAAIEKKRLDLPKRNKLLRAMTDEVAALVLRDNYLQTQALSTVEAVATQQLDEHAHLIRSLELSGELNRALEFLPTSEDLADRAQEGRGLTRPELSVLLAYSKIALYARLIESDVPEDPYLGRELERYFPQALQHTFARLLPQHRLRREIIATATTNSLVNRMGPSFARSVQEDTGANAATVARAYTIAREIYGARDVWAQIESLDSRLIATAQYRMQLTVIDLLRSATYWLLRRHPERLNIESQVLRLQPGITELRDHIPQLLRGSQRERYDATFENLQSQGAGETLAGRIASLEPLYSAPDIVEVSEAAKLPIARVAAVYFAIGAQLGFDWLRTQASSLDSLGHWQSVALGTLRDNTYSLQRTICAQVLGRRRKGSVEAVIENWLTERRTPADAANQTLAEMRTLPSADFATLSVALQAVRRLTEV
jgi:glutamate dehydrogenase